MTQNIFRVRVRYTEESWTVESFLHKGSAQDAFQAGIAVGKRLGIENPSVTVRHVGQILREEVAA